MRMRLGVGNLLFGAVLLSGCVSRLIAEDTDGLLDDDDDGDVDSDGPVDDDVPDPTTGEPPIPECIDVVAQGAFPIRVSGNTSGANDDYVPMCASENGSDNAVLFTAPADGEYEFSTQGSGIDTVLQVLAGVCEGPVLACNDDAVGSASSVRVPLSAGQDVTAVVDGFGVDGPWELTISQIDVAACPSFELGAEPAPLSFGAGSSGGPSLLGGTCGGDAGPEVTFVWTPPESGIYTVDTLDASFDSVLYLLEGRCAGNELICNDDFNGGLGSSFTAELPGGVPVTIVVDSLDPGGGEFTLNVSPGPGSCSAVGQVFGAPIEIVGGLPTGSDLAGSTCGGAGSEDATYSWTPEVTGTYFATATADFPAILSVTQDCSEVTCATPADQPRVSFDAVAGETYIIAVDTEGPTAGEFSLRIEQAECPEFTLDSVPFLVVEGSTNNASDSATLTCVNGGRDHTYSWTAPFDGAYEFTLAGSDFDTALSIRDGSCTSPELACDDDGAGDLQSRITMRAFGGQTLTIIIDGFDGATGNYTFEISAI